METSEAVAVARMFDEARCDGIVCSDHMIYRLALSSPYPDSPTGKPMWSPDTAWPDSWVLIGAMADGMASDDVERFWGPIERFAETVIDKVRS